ncbi:HNH endonuclease signature motif containing protein [Nitrosospira sp. Is2]|uniref:HNH endonuclease signature motif containing protein n=1 Tax=Nitrosospira sp. Is2 TaxID=3080532 RepID=UPI002952D2A0|nr:HNH endonuclease signature motif containing protein [Nitrosospira sp. Is2]WON74157.1 HNH endonuclease signature motif containing protein [Nitrosospira sp. Is2]
MAQYQRKIGKALKRQLIKEAGAKCANPGCTTQRVEIHHIKQWAVYKCHNGPDMIALCPTCHDYAHNGTLTISDETLYEWKQIVRNGSRTRASQIFVEPANQLKLLMGSFAVVTKHDNTCVFKLSNRNRLEMRILDDDLLQLSTRLYTGKGEEVLRVVENHVRVRDSDVIFDSRPGHVRVMVPANERYLDKLVVDHIRGFDPTYAAEDKIVAIDIEVVAPGLIRIQGYWPSDEVTIVIDQNSMFIYRPNPPGAIAIRGYQRRAQFIHDGPITMDALFGFTPDQNAGFSFPPWGAVPGSLE